MADQVKLEINFYSEDKASISLQTPMKQQRFGEIVLFCSFALRQMHNLGLNHPVTSSLAKALASNEDPRTPLTLLLGPPEFSLRTVGHSLKTDSDPMKNFVSADTVKIVSSSWRRGQKSFIAKLEIKNERALLQLDVKGFGMLGGGVNYYAPLSVGILLKYLALSRAGETDYLKSLSRAANRCGAAAQKYEITPTSQLFLAYQIARNAFSQKQRLQTQTNEKTSSPNWEAIEPIWYKWNNLEVPIRIQALCDEEAKETGSFLSTLVTWNMDKGNLGTEVGEAHKMGENVGKAVAMSMRASFMLGLEHGARDKKSPRTDQFISDQAKQALSMIQAASEPVNKLAIQLIGLLVASGTFSKREAEKYGEQLGSVIFRGMLGCFRVGLEYSSRL
jgi:hypothetical protein